MTKDLFFTEVKTEESDWKITHKDKILLIGSCFTDEIGFKFEQSGFNIMKNPFGVVYNPVSIAELLERCSQKRHFTASDVIQSGEYYYLFAAHGDVRGKTVGECLEKANQITDTVHDYLKSTSVVVITLGTAWSYWYKEGNVLMANCHKIPQKFIDRRILTVEEIEVSLNGLILTLRYHLNKDTKFIFTLSPVRHIKEGLQDNNLSKSTLTLAMHRVVKENADVDYFPSYEIVTDELRDYRFYAKDLVHVNETTVDYIWQRFSQTYFSQRTKELNGRYVKLYLMKNHRPINPDSEGYKKHCEKIRQEEEKIKDLENKADNL